MLLEAIEDFGHGRHQVEWVGTVTDPGPVISMRVITAALSGRAPSRPKPDLTGGVGSYGGFARPSGARKPWFRVEKARTPLFSRPPRCSSSRPACQAPPWSA
jgi:hypothetical protein